MAPEPAPQADGGAPDAPVAKPPKVFISYRRHDTPGFVEALDVRLRQDLKSENVFRDTHDLIAGERFGPRLAEEIGRSDVALVVIGPHWDGAPDDHSGPCRLADGDDFVRNEVRMALSARPRSTPMPLLVDGATFPKDLPADIAAIKEHHGVAITREELAQDDAAAYQSILVGIWDAKRRSVPNGVLMLTGDSPKAKANLDALVEEMQKRNLIDVSQITRYACGAQVLSMRKARNLARRYPNVIVVIDEESAGSPVLANRTDALSRFHVGKVATLTIGGAITYGAGVAVGSGALGNLSSPLGGALVKLGAQKSVTSAAKLWSWQATTPVAVKVTAGVIALGAVGGGGVALTNQLEPGPHELAGTWVVDDWQIVDGSIQPVTAQPNTLPDETWIITADPEDCHGDRCELDVERHVDDELAGLRLQPATEGWVGAVGAGWMCERTEQVSSEGRAEYTVRHDPESDTLQVDYAYAGTLTDPAPTDCVGLTGIEFTAIAVREG